MSHRSARYAANTLIYHQHPGGPVVETFYPRPGPYARQRMHVVTERREADRDGPDTRGTYIDRMSADHATSLHDLIGLLRRYSENELDQFDLWRLKTTYGEVYSTISRKPVTGMSPNAYDDLDTWSAAHGVD